MNWEPIENVPAHVKASQETVLLYAPDRNDMDGCILAFWCEDGDFPKGAWFERECDSKPIFETPLMFARISLPRARRLILGPALNEIGFPVSGAELHVFRYANGVMGEERIATFEDAECKLPQTNPVFADENGIFPTVFIRECAASVMIMVSDGVRAYTNYPTEPANDLRLFQ